MINNEKCLIIYCLESLLFSTVVIFLVRLKYWIAFLTLLTMTFYIKTMF